jgi:hypothetical protein
MPLEQAFTGGFLVLGFVLFVTGFLTGMLAFAIIPVSADVATMGFLFFVLGFLTAIISIALVMAIIRFRKSQ